VFAAEDNYGDGFGFVNGYVYGTSNNQQLFYVSGNYGDFFTASFQLLMPPPSCVDPYTGNTFTTTQSGAAEDPNTWTGGIAPQNGDMIIVNHPISINDTVVFYEITTTIDTPFVAITGSLRTKRFNYSTPTYIPQLYLKGCEYVGLFGTDSLFVDELVIESGDSLFVNQLVTINRFKFPEDMTSDFYWEPDSIRMVGSINTPPIIHYPSTSSIITNGLIKTFEYPFTQSEAGWCMEGSVGTTSTIGDYNGGDYPTGLLYMYDETVVGNPNSMDSGYVAPPLGNLTPLVGEGFFSYLNSGTYLRKWEGIDLFQGNFVKNLSYTSPNINPSDFFAGGWNLLSNLYPCTINLDSLSFTSSPQVIYTWNTQLRQYQYYIIWSGFGTRSNLLAGGQAFWVKTNSTGNTLTIPQNSMVWSLAEYRDTPILQKLYKFQLSNNEQSYSTHVQILGIENVSMNIDDYEVFEFNANNVSCPVLLYSKVQDQEIAFQSIPENEDTVYVSLFGKIESANDSVYFSMTTDDVNPLLWEVRWAESSEWIPITTNLVVPNGVLTNQENFFATVRLIPAIQGDDSPYPSTEFLDGIVKDDADLDITSSMKEEKDQIHFTYQSGTNEITTSLLIDCLYNLVGQRISFTQEGNIVRVHSEEKVIIIRSVDKTTQKIIMH
jgi:hypothetical protein